MNGNAGRGQDTARASGGGRGWAARRVALLVAAVVLAVAGTREIRALRAFRETVVVSDAFTRQVPLSTYFEGIRGTLAWFDSDPARKQVDQEANALFDRLIDAYEHGTCEALKRFRS